MFATYFGFVLSGGKSLVWITPRTVKITSSVSESLSSSPLFMIRHEVGFVNSLILFEFQKFVLIYEVRSMFVVLRDVFTHFVNIR